MLDLFREMLLFIGENPDRPGLLDTPARARKAWQEWFSGYKEDPIKIFKCFTDGAENVDQLILIEGIPFYSHCEHHLAPFFGTATIGYIPNGKIIGLSKIPRMLDIYARRLQVQERLTVQVVDTLQEVLQPLGCGAVIRARHLCMESRGICKQGHVTVTSALRGVMLDNPSARAEFFSAAQ